MAHHGGVFSNSMRLKAGIGILLAVALGLTSGLPSLCAARCSVRVTTGAAEDRAVSQAERASPDEACTDCPSRAGEHSLGASDCANFQPMDLLVERPFSLAAPEKPPERAAPAAALPSEIPTINSFQASYGRHRFRALDIPRGPSVSSIFLVTLRL
jgi:hypothetical protein